MYLHARSIDGTQKSWIEYNYGFIYGHDDTDDIDNHQHSNINQTMFNVGQLVIWIPQISYNMRLHDRNFLQQLQRTAVEYT